MAHAPPQFREPGSIALPYGLPLGVSVQSEFELDGSPGTIEMAVDGSVTSQFFGNAKQAPVAFHTFMFVIQTESNFIVPGRFGDLLALTNGLRLIVRDADDVQIGSFPSTAIKKSADFYHLAPEFINYDQGVGSDKSSVVAIKVQTQPTADAIALPENFTIGVEINDDLTDLLSFRVTAFGRNLNPNVNRTDS